MRQNTHTDGVDVRLVASEGLSAHALTDVPEFGRGIAGSWHEQPGVRSQRQTHHIPGVTRECGRLLTGLYVPESTAGQITTFRCFKTHTHTHTTEKSKGLKKWTGTFLRAANKCWNLIMSKFIRKIIKYLKINIIGCMLNLLILISLITYFFYLWFIFTVTFIC